MNRAQIFRLLGNPYLQSAGLFVVALVLLLGMSRTYLTSHEPPGITSSDEGTITVPSSASLNRRPLLPSDYRIIGDDNLFHPERQPFPKEVVRSTPPPAPTPENTPVVEELKDYKVKLTGIMRFGRHKKAFIDATTPNMKTPGEKGYTEGDMIDDLVVKRITSHKVYLQRGQEMMELEFDRWGDGGLVSSGYEEAIEKYHFGGSDKPLIRTDEYGRQELVQEVEAPDGSKVFVKAPVRQDFIEDAARGGDALLEKEVPKEARTISGWTMTADDIITIAEKNRGVVDESKGGTYISGEFVPNLKPPGKKPNEQGEIVDISGAKFRRLPDGTLRPY